MDRLSYFYIFLQSSCLEVLVYAVFYRGNKAIGESFLLTTFANSVTHPLVFFVIMASQFSYLQSILLAESFAIIAETFMHFYFGRLAFGRAALAALTANLFSWQLAPVLTYYIFLS